MADSEKITRKEGSSHGSLDGSAVHQENADGLTQRRKSSYAEEKLRANLNAKIANPLAGYRSHELEQMGEDFARNKCELTDPEDINAFRVGARLAANPLKWDSVDTLQGDDRSAVQKEFTNRWSQPATMYLVIVLCSMAAAVQGMDETVVNGAQLFYGPQFGINGKDRRSTLILGLVNAAPYLGCATIGCWTTPIWNHYLGRRGTIFATCLISALACFWQGFTNTWWHLFIARFCLGLGIGPKSATVPVFAAECAPPAIRGALVMQWQVWTAFGT
jgi:hypothetical protein